MPVNGKRPCDIISERLAQYLGPHMARSAVRTFSQRALHIPPEEVARNRASELLRALRPCLNTLIGHAECEVVLSRLEVELELIETA